MVMMWAATDFHVQLPFEFAGARVRTVVKPYLRRLTVLSP